MAEASELRNRLDEAEIPEAVRKEVEKELKRLERMSSNAADYQVVRNYLEIHAPAGAIPKDGPSAGVTMATALASLYADCAARGDTAMTGEITLSGLVLPVGGIKEKVLAAHRAGIRRVILPKENASELRKLPEHVRQEIEFVLAEHIEDVLQAAIPPLAESLRGELATHTEPAVS